MSLTKPTLDNLRAAGTTVGDVYFPQTKLLLPFNGTNGATTTSDLSNNNVPVTFVGTSQISTAQSKFGGSSMLFDGNSDYLTVYNSSFGSFATSTFTIEFWVYYNSISGRMTHVTNYSGSSNGIMIDKSDSHVLKLNLSGGGVDITGTTTLAVGQWYHIALSGSAGSYKVFLDGVQEGSTYTGSIPTGANTWELGAELYSGTVYYPLNGYLDDIRFTAGIARYTSAFTPPTTAHSTSAGDVNKQIIVNSAADGVAIGTGGINQARIAKAWVSFNSWNVAVTILDSYNISSVTDHGAGDYEVIFATAMSDDNYSQVISSTAGGTWTGYGIYSTLDRSTTGSGADDSTTTSFGISTGRYGYGSRDDCARTTAVIFGN